MRWWFFAVPKALCGAIALAAITILTRNKGLQYTSYGVAAAAVAVGALAFLHV